MIWDPVIVALLMLYSTIKKEKIRYSKPSGLSIKAPIRG